MSKSKTEFPSHIIISVSKNFQHNLVTSNRNMCPLGVTPGIDSEALSTFQFGKTSWKHDAYNSHWEIFYCIFYNYTSSKFCYISTDPIRVFSRFDVRHSLAWGTTNSLTFAEAKWSLWLQIREHKSWSLITNQRTQILVTSEIFWNSQSNAAATPQTFNKIFAASPSSYYCHLQYTASPNYCQI